ncbi:hypothetical protein WS45_06100 [Burkholderia sp. RF2-non_BP3]|nr:hypothetical protein WS45_06100 [Burkholderia sp. RF2-non_BP3]
MSPARESDSRVPGGISMHGRRALFSSAGCFAVSSFLIFASARHPIAARNEMPRTMKKVPEKIGCRRRCGPDGERHFRILYERTSL